MSSPTRLMSCSSFCASTRTLCSSAARGLEALTEKPAAEADGTAGQAPAACPSGSRVAQAALGVHCTPGGIVAQALDSSMLPAASISGVTHRLQSSRTNSNTFSSSCWLALLRRCSTNPR